MESLIHEPVNVPSTNYVNSSDDEDVVWKRNITKPMVIDSDEENSGPAVVMRQERHSESDTEERINSPLLSGKRKLLRTQKKFGSDSEESDNDNLPLVKQSLTLSSTKDSDDIGSPAEKSTGQVSSSTAAEISSSASPKFNKSLFSKSDLYDAEDSDDDSSHGRNIDPNEDSPAPMPERDSKNKTKKKKPTEKKAPKLKASKDNLQKIHSESQRMVRESRVSLPYHRPRQRTLAEFLSRRQQVVLPVTTLKTSPTKLGAVWKTLEDQVKEAEEFYKSDSDSGLDEEVQNSGPGGEQTNEREGTGEGPVEKQETVPTDDTIKINGLEADPASLESTSDIPVTIADKTQDVPVEAETQTILPDTEGCKEVIECPVVVDVCSESEEGLVVPSKSENDENNSLCVSVEASNVTGDLKETVQDEEIGEKPEENESKVNAEIFSHNSKDISDVPSAINNIDNAVTRDKSNSKSGNCLDSHSKNSALLNTISNDFSNLFPKSETPVAHEASEPMDSSPLTTVNKLGDHEYTGLCRSKVPSPPPFEDSESISLRLDDDTVDESGPKPESSCVLSMPGCSKDVTNSAAQPREEADEAPRVSLSESSKDVATSADKPREEVEEAPRMSTPVRMLMELDEMGSNSLTGDDKVGQPKNSSSLAAGADHMSASLIKLDGAPDHVIDLDEDVRSYPNKEVGVRDLMARFIKHHIPKKVACEERKVDIGIEVLEGGGDKGPEKVKREVMTVTLGGGDPMKNASPGTERPGARLRSLREELHREIARKRDEEWAKRQQEYTLGDEEAEEGGKCNLDIEEEEELTDSSSSSEEEEEELEEDDVDMSSKSRPKSAFVDDEAEESDEEGDEVNKGLEDSDEGSLMGEKEDEEALILEEELESEKTEIKLSSDVKEMDSPTKEEEAPVASPTSSKKRKFQRFKTFDLFDSEDEDIDASEYNSTAGATSPPSTPFAHSRKGAQGRLSLPSPALPLTALQRYSNSPTTFGQTSPWAFTQKQLFNDEDSPKHTEDEKDSLKGKSALLNLVGQSQDSEVAEDELLNLMSGAFLSRANKMSETEDDFSLNLEDTQEIFDKSQSKEKVKEEEADDEASSMKGIKNYGKSSWSKVDLSLNDENEKDEDDKEITLGEDLEATTRRKKLKRLNISDDEDEELNMDQDRAKSLGDKEEDLGGGSDVEQGSGDESEGESGVEGEEEESDLDEEEGVERVVEYDSEENAIVVEKRAVKKVRGPRRGLEFLEAEAELSEGEEEWEGSGDEDERGLDRMEKEEGDADKLDDEIVRRELGRIHMRQVLDEDKREVRLLQEIFLEDGELHADGQGRERKFRWRNVDNMDDGDFRPTDSGDEEKVDDEDENEEKWRRLRHEREMWLREHQQSGKSQDAESLLNDVEEDSQLLKLGRAALRRINSFPNNSLTKWLKPTVEPKEKESEAPKPPDKDPGSPDVKRPFQMLCRRGSFLARKDGTLERLAEIAMKTSGGMEPECLTSTSPVVAKTKNSRKFVFTVLSPEKKDPKANMEPPKESSLPARKCVKRKKRDPKDTESLSKKSKPCKEASIFQFL